MHRGAYPRELGHGGADTLAPSLRTSYLAFDNSLRLALQALGIKSKKAEGIMDLGKYVEEKYGKRKEEK